MGKAARAKRKLRVWKAWAVVGSEKDEGPDGRAYGLPFVDLTREIARSFAIPGCCVVPVEIREVVRHKRGKGIYEDVLGEPDRPSVYVKG